MDKESIELLRSFLGEIVNSDMQLESSYGKCPIKGTLNAIRGQYCFIKSSSGDWGYWVHFSRVYMHADSEMQNPTKILACSQCNTNNRVPNGKSYEAKCGNCGNYLFPR